MYLKVGQNFFRARIKLTSFFYFSQVYFYYLKKKRKTKERTTHSKNSLPIFIAINKIKNAVKLERDTHQLDLYQA